MGSGGAVMSPILNVFRAPTDNDGFKLLPTKGDSWGIGGKALTNWRKAGLDIAGNTGDVKWSCEQHESANGTETHAVFTVPDSMTDLARVGLLYEFDAAFTHWRWYGRGPHENYPDRCASAMMGIYEGKLDELPYVVPQEFGLRMECRWIELIDLVNDCRVRIEGIEGCTFHASATRHTPTQLYAAADITELQRNDSVVVCIDAVHRGVGTASCGPDVLPQYRITPGEYRLDLRLT